MASLREIMNVDDDHAENPQPVKRVLEPGPRPPHGPENSFPSRSAFSSSHPTLPPLATRRSPVLAYPQRARSSPTSAHLGSASESSYRRRSNASADSMDSYHGHSYYSDRSAPTSATMRPNLPTGGPGETPPVKLTPITGRVSKAKKGVPVHECDICQPPKHFTRAEHLRRHQLSHQPPDLVCQVPGCDKAFHREDLLRRHQQRHEQEAQMASQPQPVRLAPSDPGASYGSSGYQSMASISSSYGSPGANLRPGSGQSTSDSSWPTRPMPSSSPAQLSPQDQYSLGTTLLGHSSSSTLLPGYDEPRTSPSMMGSITSLHTPDAGSSSYRWHEATAPPSSSSSSVFSTTDSARLTQLPTRSLAEEAWPSTVSMVSVDGSSAGSYSTIPFAYDSAALTGSMSLPLAADYHDDASLYASRDYETPAVRSPPPPRNAVAQSSETLVTAATPLSTESLIQPACQAAWEQGIKTDATADSLASPGLSHAARRAIPGYVDSFWDKVAPMYPVVHRSSLDAAVTIPEHREVLACAMAAVATQFSDHADDRINGSQLHAYAWNKAKTYTDSDPWPLPIAQTMLLCEYFARYRGRKKGAHIASPRFAQLYQMMSDPNNTFASIPSEGSIDQRWRVWIDMETRRRLLAACFLLDVHSMRYLEQPPTKVRGLEYTSQATLAIPLSDTTTVLWSASKAKDWGDLLSIAQPSKTLAGIRLDDLSEVALASAPRFDWAILLAGLTLQLPPRSSSKKLDFIRSPLETNPMVHTIATLFHESASANAYLALQHTPLHILLSVSGDSWVFNQKVSQESCFAEHRQQLQAWRASGSAAVATAFAARALKAFLEPCIRHGLSSSEPTLEPTWACISDYWGFYVCTLICWACGALDVGGSSSTPFSVAAALRSVNTLAQLQPAQVHSSITRQDARRVVGLGRRVLAKDCLGGRSILLADAVNVLLKLDEGHTR